MSLQRRLQIPPFESGAATAPIEMETTAKTARDTQVAAAMDRVLAAERDCEVAIQMAEQDASDRLEQARAFRRELLARTQTRITALHARVAAALEDDAETVRARIVQILQADRDENRHTSIEQSIQTLAARLTGVEPPDDRHDS